MDRKKLIKIEEFSKLHNIEVSFINSLKDFGLIEVMVLESDEYLEEEQLRDVEKMIRLHYDLEINIQGIDTIFYLLKQISELQQELVQTRNKLTLFNAN